jgi:hypothetical protein
MWRIAWLALSVRPYLLGRLQLTARRRHLLGRLLHVGVSLGARGGGGGGVDGRVVGLIDEVLLRRVGGPCTHFLLRFI